MRPVTPGTFVELVVEATNHLGWRFEAGHRLGLIITSSSHSRFERASNQSTLYYEDATAHPAVINTLSLGASTLTVRVQNP